MAKPTQKLRPFDPKRTVPVPSNPRYYGDQNEPTEAEEKREEQRFMAPSKRDVPELRMCKGGKVISTRRM